MDSQSLTKARRAQFKEEVAHVIARVIAAMKDTASCAMQCRKKTIISQEFGSFIKKRLLIYGLIIDVKK
jgi:hypothetical protein